MCNRFLFVCFILFHAGLVACDNDDFSNYSLSFVGVVNGEPIKCGKVYEGIG